MLSREQALGIFHSPRKIEFLGKELVEIFDHCVIEAVVGLGTNGAILAQIVALHLTEIFAVTGHRVFVVCAEIDSDQQTVQFRPGDEQFLNDQSVLFVTDIIDSKTVPFIRSLVEIVTKAGGEVAGIGAVWNDNKATLADLGGVNTVSLTDCPSIFWEELAEV